MAGTSIDVAKPRLPPVLDPSFEPAVLYNRAFRAEVRRCGAGRRLAVAVEREGGQVARRDLEVLPADHPAAAANLRYVERLVKFLLWQRGGFRVMVSGAPEIAEALRRLYAPGGARAFDYTFWGETVFARPFTVETRASAEMPAEVAGAAAPLRTDWKGWRLGFDLGASDRKIAVVKDGGLALKPDGEPVLSAEFEWNPKVEKDPRWHYERIMETLRLGEQAVRALDPAGRVTAIGGSSAGIFIGGRPRVASLFRGVEPRERFEREVAPMFERMREAWGGIPLRIENDGDVTALAGAVALRDNAVLGLAMGSSLAAGYVDPEGRIQGWMNELAFAPLDYRPDAAADEWSGDRGVGANYLSQQAVGRLIPLAGIAMPEIPEADLPRRLVRVQELMRQGDARARRIYETIGRYLGYTVAHAFDFYPDIRHVEILGRVMTGDGGRVILDEARRVLDAEFPELAERFSFYEPSEREKRHGQAAAAAHLPA